MRGKWTWSTLEVSPMQSLETTLVGPQLPLADSL